MRSTFLGANISIGRISIATGEDTAADTDNPLTDELVDDATNKLVDDEGNVLVAPV